MAVQEQARQARPADHSFWRPLLLKFLFAGTLATLILVIWFGAGYEVTSSDEVGNGVRPAYWFAVRARSALLSVPVEDRGRLWTALDALLRTCFDIPLFMLGAGGDRLTHFKGLQSATGGLPAPFMDGLMYFSYKDVSENIMAQKHDRGLILGAQAVPPYCMGPETLIFLSNGPLHSQIKDLLVDAVRGFHVNETEPSLRHSVQWMGEPVLTAADNPSEDTIKRYVVATLYRRFFGAPLDPELATLFEGYFVWGGLCVLGQTPNKLTFGLIGDNVMKIRETGMKTVRHTPMARMVAEAVAKNNACTGTACPERLDAETMIAQTLDGFLFAGMFGTSQLTMSNLLRIRSNPALYVPMFKKDPRSFMVEQARLDPPVTSVSMLLHEDRVVHLGPGQVGPNGEYLRGGQSVLFKKGSTAQLAISAANRDPAVFGKTAHLFQPDRPTLSRALSWNGIWQDVVIGVAPRGCPGSALSLEVAQSVIEQFLPLETDAPSDTPAPGDCYDMPCTKTKNPAPIVYERLPRSPSLYDMFFVVVLILSCVHQLVVVSGREGPINASWWWFNIASIASLSAYLLNSIVGMQILWFWSSWCLLLVVIVCACQRNMLLGLLFSTNLLAVGVFFTLFFLVLSFALGDYFTPSLFRLIFVAHAISWSLFTFNCLIFSRKPKHVALVLLSWFLALAGALSVLVPNIGVLLAVVAFLCAQACLAKTIEALNELFPSPVTLHTFHFNLPRSVRIVLGYVLLFFVVYLAFTAYSAVQDHASGRICKDDSNPLCTASKLVQLDLYTRFLFQNVLDEIDAESPELPPANLISIPKRRVQLPAIEALPFPWYLPFEDEDVEYIHVLAKLQDKFINDFLHSKFIFPLTDLDLRYDSAAEGRRTLVLAAGQLADGVARGNHSSDEGMTRWAFYGLAAHLVRLVPTRSLQQPSIVNSKEVYVVDLLSMSELEVREGFEHFGAAAYFDQQLKVTRIVLRRGIFDVDYFPGTPGWEHAKFTWRSSVLVSVTLRDHLAQTHLKISSIVVQSSRETLPVNHPLRRFLAPFTYRTIEVNRGAASYLCAELGILHRATSLSLKGVLDGFRNALYSPLKPFFWDVEGLEFIPFNQDGLEFKNIVNKFVCDYVDLYYPTDDALYSDPPLSSFTQKIESFGLDLPDIRTREDITNLLTHFIVGVTGFHHHVGTVSEFVIDPEAATGKIRPDVNIADVQASVQTMIIALFTSFKQPALINDFTHLLLRDDHLTESVQIFNTFQEELKAFAKVVEARNAQRPWPVDAFNPVQLLSAVSI